MPTTDSLRDSRFGKQVAEILAALNAIPAEFALMGGLALAAYKVMRAVPEVELLLDGDQADAAETALLALGYARTQRNEDTAAYARNEARDDERVKFIYAHRPLARALLNAARGFHTELGDLRIVSAEGLIGFKLQALVNDTEHLQPLEDIRALMLANRMTLDLEQVREFFRLFDQERLLDALLKELR